MNRMQIEQITAAEANAILEGKHYLGPTSYQPRFCLATPNRDALAIYSYPIAAHFKTTLNDPLELARLWRADDACIPLSQFLAKSLRYVRKLAPFAECVFTYADPAAQDSRTGKSHNGGIYRAANFTFVRQARATDQWEAPTGDRISAARAYRILKTKSPKRIAELKPEWRLIEGIPKLLFVYPLRIPVEKIVARIDSAPNERRAKFSKAHSGFRVGVYQERFPAKTCAHCGHMFLAARPDAKTCSHSCRTMLYLKRRSLADRFTRDDGLIINESTEARR